MTTLFRRFANFPSRPWLLLAVGIFASLGFRVYPGSNRWRVDASSPKLWVKFTSRPAINKNDLPSNDPLFGQTLTFTNVTQSVFDDYASISTSYLRLADTATDGTFASSDTEKRVITVDFTAPTTGDGLASRTAENNIVTECKIQIRPGVADSAKLMVWVLTHEIGHCLGLDHPQETIYAAMSYFSDHNYPRLQTDDKMGMTYLFPTDPSYAVERATWGLSCSPK